jgi:hypothetical protein
MLPGGYYLRGPPPFGYFGIMVYGQNIRWVLHTSKRPLVVKRFDNMTVNSISIINLATVDVSSNTPGRCLGLATFIPWLLKNVERPLFSR